MAFTELSEFLAHLDAGALQSAPRRAELIDSLQGLQRVFLHLGASAPAAQLDLASQLLRSFGEGEAAGEWLAVVRRMVAPIEQAFRIQEAPAPAVPVSGESRGYLKARLCVARDMLLGEMLVHFGVVEPDDLSAALAEKQHSTKRLGEILVRQGATTAEEIERALSYQARVRGERAAAESVRTETKASAKAAGKKTGTSQPKAALPRPERAAPLRLTSALLLGEILYMQGAVSREGLARGMAEQRRSGRMLGEILLDLGLVTRRQLEHALSFQGNPRLRSSVRRAA
jgi:uncharacterized protein (DUF433 family)